MLHAMLDTNLCIRVLRDRPADIRKRFAAEAGQLAISTIVLHELHAGVLRSPDPERHLSQLEDFVPRLTVLDFDDLAALHAADIKAELLKRGNVIGPNDLLIAGHARSLGVKLITGNLREFQRVDGLRCEDWL
ncbi:MAG: PIN domain-containing protein [Candidatus Andeanibacterium colombiense]|uniref:Ribonuclease VapC n=1 Tax=Candidatus Andeanibacterium colombiense TaxID=3121345 RepID=A0AAJ5X7X0_9SPHN|nr:MAG: PIN domain-containing protein [Sphingomonadaceae bacterium]